MDAVVYVAPTRAAVHLLPAGKRDLGEVFANALELTARALGAALHAPGVAPLPANIVEKVVLAPPADLAPSLVAVLAALTGGARPRAGAVRAAYTLSQIATVICGVHVLGRSQGKSDSSRS